MDKVLQRTQNALRNAARKKARKQAEKDANELYNARQSENMRKQFARTIVKDEQRYRKEDWRVGPRLAPRRDVGENADRYATIAQALISPPRKTAMFSKGFVPYLSPEDRVVILEGRDKGKIARIESVDEDSQTVKMKGMNQADYYIPEFMRIEGGHDRSIVPVSLHLPMSSVRLVFALEDSNGNFRDVVVDKVIVEKASRYDIENNGADKRGRRYVPGLNAEIPWPRTEEPEHEVNPGVDTRRLDVDPETYKLSLLNSPFPNSVIDELRNKYSAFRTRHDPEYIARREAQAAEKPRVKVLEQMASTPMQELIARNKKERAERQKKLTEEQLAAIGEVMAREKMEAAQKKVQGGLQTQTS